MQQTVLASQGLGQLGGDGIGLDFHPFSQGTSTWDNCHPLAVGADGICKGRHGSAAGDGDDVPIPDFVGEDSGGSPTKLILDQGVGRTVSRNQCYPGNAQMLRHLLLEMGQAQKFNYVGSHSSKSSLPPGSKADAGGAGFNQIQLLQFIQLCADSPFAHMQIICQHTAAHRCQMIDGAQNGIATVKACNCLRGHQFKDIYYVHASPPGL